MSALVVLTASSWLLALLLGGRVLWRRLSLRRRLGGCTRLRRPSWEPTARLRLALALAVAALWAFWRWMGLPDLPSVLVAAGLALYGTRLYASWRAESERRRLEVQLPMLVWHLASSLQAGLSLASGLERAAPRLEAPASGHVVEALRRYHLGQDAALGLATSLGRIEGQAPRILVGALLLHRRVGLNLIDAFHGAAEGLARQAALREEVEAATAEARTSQLLVAVLPVATLILIRLAMPQQAGHLLAQPIGWALLGYFLLAQAAALTLTRRLTASVQP